MSNNINSLDEAVLGLRENKGLLLRQVPAELEVDTTILSKMERNERGASSQ